MSTNYNHALFRQMQAPIQNTLKQLDEALNQVLSGERPAGKLGLEEDVHTMATNLDMIERRVLSTLGKSLEGAVVGINHPEPLGWDHVQVQTVARHLLDITSAFSLHLQDLAAGGDDLHVRLWPLWKKLNQSMGKPDPDIYDLFEIDPNFNDQRFRPLGPKALIETVLGDGTDGPGGGINGRFIGAIGLVEVARTNKDMETALQSALDEVNRLYGLHHKRFYQAYWLILRARLSVGLMKPDDLVDQRKEWLALLREASLQINKFGENHRRIKIDRLYQAMGPLIRPWPAGWGQAHPILSELDRRFGMTVFWQAVDEVLNDTQDGAAAQFFSRQKELNDSINQLRQSWNRFVGNSDEHRKAALAQFLRALILFLSKKSWFPGNFADPLFDGLKLAGDKLAERLKEKEQRPVDDAIAFEVAATILLIEELVERRARWNQELESRIVSRAHRLSMALDGRGVELRSLAPLRWDPKWKERQAGQALQAAMGLVANHANIISKALTDLSKGEDVEDVRERLDELVGRSDLIGKVLLTLRQPLAARMALGFVPRIEKALSGQNVDENLSVLAKGLASLSGFLLARRNGDVDVDSVLSAGFDALFGEGAFQNQIQTEAEQGCMAIDVPAMPLVSPPSSAFPVAPVLPEVPAVVREEVPVVPPIASKPATRNIKAEILADGAIDEVRDEEIVQVFLEEAEVALEEVRQQRSILVQSPHEEEAWATLKRQFHTLKGSGRISGLLALGEVAYWIEDRLNDAILSNEPYRERLDSLVALAAERLSNWYDELRQGQRQIVVMAMDVYQAVQQALPETDEGSIEGNSSAALPPLEDVDLEAIWPSDEPASSPEFTEEDRLDQLVRKDAQQHADALSSQIIHREMGGEWDFSILHVSSHTLASLGHSDEWRPMALLGRAVERGSELPLALSIPDSVWFESVSLLRDMGNSLAANYSCPEDDEVLSRLNEALDSWGELEEGAPAMPFDSGLYEETAESEPRALENQPLATGEAEDDKPPLDETSAVDGFDTAVESPVVSLHDDEWDNIVPPFESTLEAETTVETSPATLPDQGEPDVAEGQEEPVLPDYDGSVLSENLVVEESLEDAIQQDLNEPGHESFSGAEGSGVVESEAMVVAEPQGQPDSDLNVFSGPEASSDEENEREAIWNEVFQGIDMVQEGFARLAAGLIKLREMDERD